MNNSNPHSICKTKASNNTCHFNIIRFTMLLSLCLALCFSVFSQSNDIPARPVPQRLVNDFSAIFKPQQVQNLERMLVDYNDSTSTQIAVITVNSLNGYDAADYVDRLAEKWGVGRKGKDNGVVILIKPKLSASDYGEVRVSVGYGLEDVIPDAIAKRIVDQEMIPRFKEGDYYGGVVAATGVIMDLASGKYTADQYGDDVNMTMVIVGVSIFILLFVKSLIFGKKSKSGRPPFIVLGGMGGSGKSGGGGSRSGGFGGFGGGSFGGGGARGRW
jgi:uncharacterized protein